MALESMLDEKYVPEVQIPAQRELTQPGKR
jgi:hypothetical protein